MARPVQNTVDYFPHIISEGKKMFFIENKYGNDGYATWFKILEKLATTDYHYLDLNNEEEILYLSARCRVSEEKLISIIDDLSKIGSIHKALWKQRVIWSEKFIESIADAYARRNNKCMHYEGLCKHLQGLCIQKPELMSKKDYSNTQSRVEESRVEEKGSHYRSFDHLKISVVEYTKLIENGYSKKQVDKILDSIENYKQNKKYKSLYLTAIKWLEKEYPPVEQQTEPTVTDFLSQL